MQNAKLKAKQPSWSEWEGERSPFAPQMDAERQRGEGP